MVGFEAFNGMFQKVPEGGLKVTLDGGIAVRSKDGNYKTYNLKTGTFTNIGQFAMDMNMFFIVPTNKVKPGDIIFVGGKPVCVINSTVGRIEFIDYDNGELKAIVPENIMFMGKNYLYQKVFNPCINMFSGKKGTNNMMKMMMFQQLFNGGNEKGMMNMGGMNGMGGMLMLSMLGGESNPLSGLMDGFNLDWDEDEDEEPAEETKE